MIQSHILSLRLALIEEVRGIRYTPSGTCPDCGRKLSPLEIIQGFNDDPNDFTTVCTNCHKRFEPKLRHTFASGSIELPFYCSSQTLNQMNRVQHLDPDRLQQEEPAIYHSAIVHHGTLHNAFRKIGVEYQFAEVVNWETKIIPFLGELPDKVIAEVAGVSSAKVGKLRRDHRIPRCTRKLMLEAAMEEN
jgi:hypothetical protein